jgi:hypothetical protein
MLGPVNAAVVEGLKREVNAVQHAKRDIRLGILRTATKSDLKMQRNTGTIRSLPRIAQRSGDWPIWNAPGEEGEFTTWKHKNRKRLSEEILLRPPGRSATQGSDSTISHSSSIAPRFSKAFRIYVRLVHPRAIVEIQPDFGKPVASSSGGRKAGATPQQKTGQIMAKPTNIEELRDQLLDTYEAVKDDPAMVEQCREMTNCAGKIINTVKIQLEYALLRAETPVIDFMGGDKSPRELYRSKARQLQPTQEQ